MSANYEDVTVKDEQMLFKLLNEDRYVPLKTYQVNFKMFYKYGKYDKNDELKAPALTKNGIAIPAQIKLVSAFNRITDDVDVKIIINYEMWQELSDDERISVLDNLLYSIQTKEDKNGEPLFISEDCDKIQLKLRKPDFLIEGFVDVLREHKTNYLPWKDAHHISDMI